MAWKCAGCDTENPVEADFCTKCGAPNPVEGTADMAPAEAVTPDVQASQPPDGAARPPKKKKSWVWILGIVLLLVLGACLIISAIIAAIAIPNFLQAKERALQKRTIADMRNIATAVQIYGVDFGEFPQPGHDGAAYYALHEVSVLESFLVPDFLMDLPAVDAWGNPLQYGISEDSMEFMLLSTGSDGESQLEEIPEEFVETHCYEDDILWENDDFLQVPVGQQSQCR